MSNIATIQPTIFCNHDSGHKTYGVRVYDNYGQSYDNTWEYIPDDDIEVLKLVVSNDNEVMSAIIDFIVENEGGIMIGQEYYDWEKIKKYLEK